MFGKRQKRKTAIVKFVKIIVESSNAIAIGYAPILRLPSGFLSDFFVKKASDLPSAAARNFTIIILPRLSAGHHTPDGYHKPEAGPRRLSTW
jgi:hypothetical protein